MGGPLGAQPAHATTRVAKNAQAADELDFAQTQLRSSGSPLVIKVIQGAAVAGTAGASIAYVLAQQRKADETKKREAQEYLNMVMQAEQKIVDGDGGKSHSDEGVVSCGIDGGMHADAREEETGF